MKHAELLLPLWGPASAEIRIQRQTPKEVQNTIAERIAMLLGGEYTPTNKLFITFINRYGHPAQLQRDDNEPLSEQIRLSRITEITDFESQFDDPRFNSAACIAMEEQIREKPLLIGFNISEILKAALAIIEESRPDEKTTFQQIGYK